MFTTSNDRVRKKIKPRLDIGQILRFHVLNLAIDVCFWIKIIADLDSCIWVPGSRDPDSRIHLSILGRNQGLKNYTDLFRLWTFFRSDLLDANSFGMSCTFLACLHGCIVEICSFLKNNCMKTQVIDDGK